MLCQSCSDKKDIIYTFDIIGAEGMKYDLPLKKVKYIEMPCSDSDSSLKKELDSLINIDSIIYVSCLKFDDGIRYTDCRVFDENGIKYYYYIFTKGKNASSILLKLDDEIDDDFFLEQNSQGISIFKRYKKGLSGYVFHIYYNIEHNKVIIGRDEGFSNWAESLNMIKEDRDSINDDN